MIADVAQREAAALNATFQLLVIYRFNKGLNLFSITLNSRLRNINSWVVNWGC